MTNICPTHTKNRPITRIRSIQILALSVNKKFIWHPKGQRTSHSSRRRKQHVTSDLQFFTFSSSISIQKEWHFVKIVGIKKRKDISLHVKFSFSMSYFRFRANLLSKGNVQLRCQENLSLDQFKYFLESMSKLLSYVVFDPFQKHCAFEPGDPDIDIAFTCVMSKGRFLDPVPKLNLHKETECTYVTRAEAIRWNESWWFSFWCHIRTRKWSPKGTPCRAITSLMIHPSPFAMGDFCCLHVTSPPKMETLRLNLYDKHRSKTSGFIGSHAVVA